MLGEIKSKGQYKLIPLLIAVLFLVLFTGIDSVHATMQVPDTLLYKGETLVLFAFPFEPYQREGKIESDFRWQPSSTACYRGYEGRWKIDKGALYLMELKICHVEETIPIEKINSDWQYPVKARWFSGEVRAEGQKINTWFSEFYYFKIVKGKVVKAEKKVETYYKQLEMTSNTFPWSPFNINKIEPPKVDVVVLPLYDKFCKKKGTFYIWKGRYIVHCKDKKAVGAWIENKSEKKPYRNPFSEEAVPE